MPELKDDKYDMENKYMETGLVGLSTATSMSDRDRRGGQDTTFQQLAFNCLVLH